MATFADLLEREDERRFVGRAQELALVDDVLAGRVDQRVVFIYGRGGMGKSTLLRHIRRRAMRDGWDVRLIDGRDALLTSGELSRRLKNIKPKTRLLLIIDTYERLQELDAHLRNTVLPALPEGSAVVIAGRSAPSAAWLQGGWERMVISDELRPLPAEDGRELLRREGINDDEPAYQLIAWSAGFPLALSIGADALRGSGAWRPRQLEDNPELAELLLRRLTDGELDSIPSDVAMVAAIARRADAAMLSEVLPGVDGQAAMDWLRSCTFAEVVDGGVALHDLVREGLLAQVRTLRPERERELRRRIVDHLYARAAAGAVGLVPDLAELVENETLRWGLGGQAAGGLRADDVRPVDITNLIEGSEAANVEAVEWLKTTAKLVSEAPSCALVARDAEDKAAGICIFVTPGNAPPAAEADPILGPWLAHARRAHPDGNVLVWRDSLDLTEGHGKQSSRVLAVMNGAAIVRCGLANPHYAYLPIDRENPAAVAFAETVKATKLDDLTVEFDGRHRDCYLLDYGEGGLLAAHRTTVYSELGLRLSEPSPDAAPTPAGDVTTDAVKEALRNIDRPLELARSPLAVGGSPRERAESVRALIVDAAEGAFGREPEEQLLAEILRRRYLDEPTTHEQVAETLHVSRATYFRHLRVVFDRVGDYVIQVYRDRTPDGSANGGGSEESAHAVGG
ncbi:MAG: ATP-binding protein [Solirubrobacteraceae bacterium]